MSNLVWVDPPSGWRYGWPKLYDKNAHPDFNKWLVDNGYPQSIIDQFPDGLICGHWIPTSEEILAYRNKYDKKQN